MQAVALADTLRDSGLIGSFGTKLKAIESKKVELIDDLLELITELDPAERSSWRSIVVAVGEAGVSDEEIQSELGTTPSTIYRWRCDDVAPKAGTRRLMKDALIGLVKQHRERLVG
jgi:hypothetical protein